MVLRNRDRRRSILRCAQITGHRVLADVVHDDLKQRRSLAGVELHRLVKVLVLLFDHLVVRIDVQRVLRVLLVQLLQLQLHSPDVRRLGALLQRELIVVTLTATLQLHQLIVVGRDQTAHHALVTDYARELSLRLREISLRAGYVRLGAGHIGLHRGDILLHCADLLLRLNLFLAQTRRRGIRLLLRRDQLIGLVLQLLLRQSDALAQRLALGTQPLVRVLELLAQLRVLLGGGRQLAFRSREVVLQPEAPAKRTKSQQQTDYRNSNQPTCGLGLHYVLALQITHALILLNATAPLSSS